MPIQHKRSGASSRAADGRLLVMPRIFRTLVIAVRWWFGTTWFLAGIGSVIAGPIMITAGNYGGLYMIGGGVVMAVAKPRPPRGGE